MGGKKSIRTAGTCCIRWIFLPSPCNCQAHLFCLIISSTDGSVCPETQRSDALTAKRWALLARAKQLSVKAGRPHSSGGNRHAQLRNESHHVVYRGALRMPQKCRAERTNPQSHSANKANESYGVRDATSYELPRFSTTCVTSFRALRILATLCEITWKCRSAHSSYFYC